MSAVNIPLLFEAYKTLFAFDLFAKVIRIKNKKRVKDIKINPITAMRLFKIPLKFDKGKQNKVTKIAKKILRKY